MPQGTITKHDCKNGRPSWGFTLFLGRRNGKRIQLTKKGFRTKEEACQKLQEAIAAKTGKVLPTKITLATYFNEWIERVRHRCSPITVDGYRERAAYLLRTLGPVQLQELTSMMIENKLYELLSHGGCPDAAHPN